MRANKKPRCLFGSGANKSGGIHQIGPTRVDRVLIQGTVSPPRLRIVVQTLKRHSIESTPRQRCAKNKVNR
jgi:hypothetical protein